MMRKNALFLAATVLGAGMLITGQAQAAGSLTDGNADAASVGTAVLEASVPGIVQVKFNTGTSNVSVTIQPSQFAGGPDPGTSDDFVVKGQVIGNAPNATLDVLQTDSWAAGTSVILKHTSTADLLSAAVLTRTFGGVNFILNGGATVSQPINSNFELNADVNEASITLADDPGAYTATLTFTAVAL